MNSFKTFSFLGSTAEKSDSGAMKWNPEIEDF